jgi:hypothetical protein
MPRAHRFARAIRASTAFAGIGNALAFVEDISRTSKREVEGDMELQTTIRTQMMMLGLGAALLMAGSVHAQQDMDPTYFDVNPGTPAVTKAAVVRLAQNAPIAEENGKAESALMLATSREGTLEAGVMRMAVVDGGIMLILLGGIVSIVMYAMAATRRERNLGASTVNASYRPVSAATAQ